MFKILYAADNREGSYFQLIRFFNSIKSLNVQIKIASYNKYCYKQAVDFNLESLLNFSNNSNNISFKNDNYVRYFNAVKQFSPNLIISDLEIYTSLIALELGIELWQVSPLLIYFAVEKKLKYNIGINKNNYYLFNSNFRKKEYIQFILNNSKKYVVSHLCDSEHPPMLKNEFSWVRPDFVLSKNNSNEISAVAASLTLNKDIVKFINSGDYFSLFTDEQHNKINLKHILDFKDYSNALGKASIAITTGSESLVADAFYNQKYCLTFPNYDDIESSVVSGFNEYFDLGESYDPKKEISIKPIKINLNEKVPFLIGKIKEIL